MALNTKAVKGRIKSVKNTRKITNAMQMIAAVKMRKAVDSATESRAYAQEVENLLNSLVSTTKLNHPLAKRRKIHNKLLVVITSDRGLCGAYNSRVLGQAESVLQNTAEDINVSVMALGKKSGEFASRHNLEIIGLYDNISDKPDMTTINPMIQTIKEAFLSEEIDQVEVVFTKYISGLKQEVEVLQLLPITKSKRVFVIDEEGQKSSRESKNSSAVSDSRKESSLEMAADQKEEMLVDQVKYEPSKSSILNYALPMLTEVRLYQALLESVASEHSSRMIAMKNATDAAGDLIDDLKLEYNKARQAAVTREIAEISAGADAIS